MPKRPANFFCLGGMAMFGKKEQNQWRDGVFLCTAKNSFEADLLESKLNSEGIPSIKKYVFGHSE